MYILVITLTVIASLLMIGVVLIQKSKGGGLSSQFGGANQVMGVRRTNSFIEKTTWYLAAIIGILAIISVFVMPRNIITKASRVAPVATEQTVPADFNTVAPATAPAAETPVAPATTPAE
ncbi:preprotein translocase subunit SecG [Muribaculum caecicola]|uniref:Preprotein translocase subunit SecG n=1 Tax=Muribaculum caecicola TaxID=3038144 RepID=A0AC61S2I0_9BACT|nr:preprotein translocase subunit SecG [Muribaculum caecicola]THG41254.1 preprotein translocase subunit SecG [Muribaculum caecicola]